MKATEITASPFARFGDSYHFKIDNHHDLNAVLALDEALWIATTAPCSTLKTDKTFLELLDSDQDGRIRAEEIKDGIRFLFSNLNDYAVIAAGNTSLALTAVNSETEAGGRIRASAEKVLKRLGKELDIITLIDVRSVKKEVLQGGLDQAGVVLPEAAEDDAIRRCIVDIIASVGGVSHPSGTDGIDADSLQAFLDQGERYLKWRLRAGEIEVVEKSEILPLGADTKQGYELFTGLSDKLYHYFLLADIRRLTPVLLDRALNSPEAGAPPNLIDAQQAESFLASAPLAPLGDDDRLDLIGEVNPYYADDLQKLCELVVKPLLGADSSRLDKAGFSRLQQIFAPFAEWLEAKPDVKVDKLEAETVKHYVADPRFKSAIEQLIERSHQTAIILENLAELERLILYQANMLPLTNSFVSFPHLYDPDKRALFEEGTLIMDGRHFTMAVKVDDLEHHIEFCKNSNIFVIYCELFGAGGTKLHEIAVPVTAGTRGTLHLNKWGIFNDLDGNELHARIVDIVENPISIGEAIAAPFVRIKSGFFLRLEEFSSKAEERLFKKKDRGKDQKADTSSGALLGIGGVAVAALGSSLAFITKTVSSMSLGTVLISLLVIAALFIIPTAILAYSRLSRRDLSAILEGSGWGLNSRMKLTPEQADHFTHRPSWPKHEKRD